MLCRNPLYLPDRTGGITPCGQCFHCCVRKRREKSTRSLLESYDHEHSLFVTLTYDQYHLPTEYIDSDTGEVLSHPLGVLSRDDIVNFNKRLRKSTDYRLKMFYVGEYGDEGRPHYHLVIFGLPYEDRRLIYDAWLPRCHVDRLDVQVPKSDWDVGQYCSKYVTKIKTRKQKAFLEGRPPEFSQWSKGFGLNFVDRLADMFSKNQSVLEYIQENGDIPRQVLINGKKLPLDRYMHEKILDKMGIKSQVKAIRYEKYQEEMRALQEAAGFDPKSEKLKSLLFENYKTDTKKKRFALEIKFEEINEPQMLLKETKYRLHNPVFDKGA